MFSHQIDVWAADIGSVETDEGLLSVRELGRALRMGSSDLLPSYLAAHTWLRRRLSRYLDVPADEIRFELGEHGKPRIASPETDLTFSLSYSGWAAVLAVGFRKDVGVDVEALDGASVDPALVSRTLTSEERESYCRAIDPIRTFLRFWVRKQSLAKATGIGVDRELGTTDVSGVAPIAVGRFEITDLNLGDQLVAAVAVPPKTTINLLLDDSMHAPVSARSRRQPIAVAG